MHPALALLLLFTVGSIAGFINVNAGGGSTLTLPVLLFLGLDAAAANGTNRIAIVVQNIFAVSSFRRNNVSEFKKSLSLSLITLPGAIAGSLLAVRIEHQWFERMLGVVMIGIVVSMIFKPRYQTDREDASPSGRKRLFVYPALFLAGLYGGFIQVGVGFIMMAILYHLLHLSLIRVNMHKVFIVLVYTLPTLVVFMLTNNIVWGYGLCLAAGNGFGAWWGAHAAVKTGEKTIRRVLAAAILIMAAKLLGLFDLLLG
ncbi:sulfite exporter TauE/SafE family protein [bacterium]|nr:sulfite exporter TauE/SafE family protein [bacterium]